jgi:hypothetical protein
MVTMDLISSIENPHNTLNYCVFVLVMFDTHDSMLYDVVAGGCAEDICYGQKGSSCVLMSPDNSSMATLEGLNYLIHWYCSQRNALPIRALHISIIDRQREHESQGLQLRGLR